MLLTNTPYTATMTQPQREWFYAEYEQARKDETIGVLLALLLGCFGMHHFYLRRTGLGILYLCFCWTGITTILGFIECFLMPGRVRVYNATQAAYIAGEILARPSPAGPAGTTFTGAPSTEPPAMLAPRSLPTTETCTACGRSIDPAAAFCPHCGAARTVTA